MTNESSLSPEERDAWRAVLRMRRALDRELDAHLAARGELTESDYEVFRPLYEAPSRELRVGALARSMEWEASRLSHKLRQMERKGLVVRRASKKDGRGSIARLTDAGTLAYERVRADHVAWTKANFIQVLSADELSYLKNIAGRILVQLERSRQERERDDYLDDEL